MLSAAFISLTTPALFWLGAAAVSLPLVAHLLNRRARQRVMFPTIRLLQASSASQTGLFKLRRLLLLLARALAVLFIALAFSRPVWTTESAAKADDKAGAAVVIVFDSSASSAQQVAGVRAFDALRAAAGRALDGLVPGRDRVNVVFAEARPRAMFPQLTANPDAVRSELDRAAPTFGRADLIGAVGMAVPMIEHYQGARRLVIVSDMQTTNWREILDLGGIARGLPAGIEIVVLPVDVGQAANVALQRARFDTPRPIAGRVTRAIVDVANFGETAATVLVTCDVDGEAIGSRSVALSPWETRDVTFDVTFRKVGSHAVTFGSDTRDALAADNRAFATAEVIDRVPVLLVSDDDPDAVGSVAYFLSRALSPQGDGRDDLAVRHAHLAAIDAAALNDVELLVITRIGSLSNVAADATAQFIRRGGGVIWFADDGPMVENFKAIDAATARLNDGDDDHIVSSPSPAEPRAWRVLSDDAEPLRITAGAWGSKLLSDFDVAGREALSRVAVRRAWSFGPLHGGATSVLDFADGSPAVIEQSLNAAASQGGRFVVVAFSPDQESSDVTRHAVFVAVVQSLVRFVRPVAIDGTAGIVGAPYTWTLDARAATDESAPSVSAADTTHELRVIGPDDAPRDAQLTSRLSKWSVYLSNPDIPGVYRIVRQGRSVAVGAVNVDAREGDLRRVDARTLGQVQSGGDDVVTVRSIDGDEPVIAPPGGRTLWHWFVVAAMAAMMIELLMLTVWKR